MNCWVILVLTDLVHRKGFIMLANGFLILLNETTMVGLADFLDSFITFTYWIWGQILQFIPRNISAQMVVKSVIIRGHE